MDKHIPRNLRRTDALPATKIRKTSKQENKKNVRVTQQQDLYILLRRICLALTRGVPSEINEVDKNGAANADAEPGLIEFLVITIEMR